MSDAIRVGDILRHRKKHRTYRIVERLDGTRVRMRKANGTPTYEDAESVLKDYAVVGHVTFGPKAQVFHMPDGADLAVPALDAAYVTYDDFGYTTYRCPFNHKSCVLQDCPLFETVEERFDNDDPHQGRCAFVAKVMAT